MARRPSPLVLCVKEGLGKLIAAHVICDRRDQQRQKTERMSGPMDGFGVKGRCASSIAVLESHPGRGKLDGGQEHCQTRQGGEANASSSPLVLPAHGRPKHRHEADIIGCLNIAVEDHAGPHEGSAAQPGVAAGSIGPFQRKQQQRQDTDRVQIEHVFRQRHDVSGAGESDRSHRGARTRNAQAARQHEGPPCRHQATQQCGQLVRILYRQQPVQQRKGMKYAHHGE